MTDEQAGANTGMDGANLWREETFTDRRVGSLQRLTPITAAGAADTSRRIVYVGQTQILTPGGALPLTFEVEADSLEEAVAQFGDRAQEALESTMQRLEEMRREQASSLIVPGGAAPGGAGTPPSGIQMP